MKIIIIVAVIVAYTLLANYFRWGYDDTDDKRPGETFGKRPGLSVYTDHKTGVQYVKGGIFGGTCPRVAPPNETEATNE